MLCLGLAVGRSLERRSVRTGSDRAEADRRGTLRLVDGIAAGDRGGDRLFALGQVPHSWEIAGIVCVAVAVAVRTADPDEG